MLKDHFCRHSFQEAGGNKTAKPSGLCPVSSHNPETRARLRFQWCVAKSQPFGTPQSLETINIAQGCQLESLRCLSRYQTTNSGLVSLSIIHVRQNIIKKKNKGVQYLSTMSLCSTIFHWLNHEAVDHEPCGNPHLLFELLARSLLRGLGIGHWASDCTSNVSKIYWIKSDGGHASPFHIHTTFGCVFDRMQASKGAAWRTACQTIVEDWTYRILLHSFATLPSSCPEFMYQDNPQHRLASESIASEFKR